MRTILDPEEYTELTDILQASEEHESVLTPREVEFVSDLQARVDIWGPRIHITEPQFEWLRRIQRRIG